VPAAIKGKANETVASLLLDLYEARSFALALISLDLLRTLDNGTHTIFAPDNRAFQAFPARDVAGAERAKWLSVIEGHLVSGKKVTRSELGKTKELATSSRGGKIEATEEGQGGEVQVRAADGQTAK